MSSSELTCVWLGRRRYGLVDELQRRLFEARRAGQVADAVLMVEFEPVVTLGRGAKAEHLLASEQLLAAQHVELFESDRGGDVTLHAPGQLVCYPIVQLPEQRRDVRRYVKDLTRVMKLLVERFGVDADSYAPLARKAEAQKAAADLVGLWADADRPHRWDAETASTPVKLGAIGVRLSRWVTLHGFALNLTTNLDLYQWIVPCGIRAYGVASVASLTTAEPITKEVAAQAAEEFAELWQYPSRHWLDAAEIRDEALTACVLEQAARTR